jgi:hypothetical protein
MDSAKLLIIGGVVLGGIYLLDKNKKDKENAQALALANSQAQPQLQAEFEVETKPTIQTVDSQAKLTPKEATVYATRTIADVNSLLVKYPAIKKDEFLKNYNSAYKTNLFLENNGNITAPKVSQEEIDAQNKNNVQQSTNNSGGFNWGGLVSQARALELAVTNSEFRVSDANRVFNDTQMGYTQWKSDFSTVYSNLKDYFSTLTKEQADVVIKYLPKMVIQTLMGDNDPRARANDFYSQEEIIDIVDNKLDTERILQSALGGFFMNVRKFNGFGNVKTVSGTGLEMSNTLNNTLTKEREWIWNAKMNEIASLSPNVKK